MTCDDAPCRRDVGPLEFGLRARREPFGYFLRKRVFGGGRTKKHSEPGRWQPLVSRGVARGPPTGSEKTSGNRDEANQYNRQDGSSMPLMIP
jgi:hypothetical protein